MNQIENAYNFIVPANGTPRAWRAANTFIPGQLTECDFRGMSLNGMPFIPSGFIADNTKGVGPLHIKINGLNITFTVAPGGFSMMPYPAPQNQTATIEGDGEATVVFVDYPVVPFMSKGAAPTPEPTEGIIEIVAGANITINNDDPQRPVISAAGGGGGGGGGGVISVGGTFLAQNIQAGGYVELPCRVPKIGDIVANQTEITVPPGVSVCAISGMIVSMGSTVDFTFGINKNGSQGASYAQLKGGAVFFAVPVTEGDVLTVVLNTSEVLTAAGGDLLLQFS